MDNIPLDMMEIKNSACICSVPVQCADTNALSSVSMRPQIINIELFSIRISILMQYDNLFTF